MLLLLIGATFAADDPFAVAATVAVLPNGLTVVLSEDHRTDVTALHLHYGVGARDEWGGERGCAHLFEHIMFEGSRNVPQNAFDGWLTDAGGWNNAFTSEDQTAYYMQFPSGATELALFLESDRMGFLLDGLTAENLANQQKVVLQERAQGYAEPHGRDDDALTRLQFPVWHPYQHPVIGTVADVEGFQLDATRAFWTRWYRPRNAVLGIVGNFDTAELLERVTHWFSDVPDTGAAPTRQVNAPPVVLDAPVRGYLEDAVEDRTLYLSWAAPERGNPHAPALDLVAYVLSNGRGTRLDERVYYGSRIALDDGAYLYSAEVGGQFVVYATTDRVSLARLEKVLLAEIARVATEPPTLDELARAKAAVRSGWLDALEDPGTKVQALVDCQREHGRPDCLAEEWARYEAVTPEDVARAAASWLAPERRTALSVVPDARSALKGSVAVELP